MDRRVNLPARSMFMATPVFSALGGTIVHGLLRDLAGPDETDQLYVVPQTLEARFDLISTLFYETPEMWHVICTVNNIIDPLLGVAPGTRIRVPTRQRLVELGVL